MTYFKKRLLTPEEIDYILELYGNGCTDGEVSTALCTSRSGLSNLVKRVPTLPGRIMEAKGSLTRSARRAMKELIDANNVPTVLQVARSKLGYSDKQDVTLHVGQYKALSDEELQRRAIDSGIKVELARSVPKELPDGESIPTSESVSDTPEPCPIDATIVPEDEEPASDSGTVDALASTMPGEGGTIDVEYSACDDNE